MKRLNEKEMRLLTSIILDASVIARQTTAAETSEEMTNAISIINLSNKMVSLTNKLYPVKTTEEDLIISSFWGKGDTK